MREAIKKTLAKALFEPVMKARERSVFIDKGRVFLDATALAYGAAVNRENQLIDADGKVMDENHEDYRAIMSRAKKQARAESPIGRSLIGP